MQTMSTSSSRISVSAALAASLCAGCLTQDAASGEAPGGVDETAQESGSDTTSVTPLPSFADTPNIQRAVSQLSNLSVIAVASTVSGFQIYRCEQGTTAPEWRLRTPLAGLAPALDVQRPALNYQRLSPLVGSYHYRSDFGGLLASAQLEALGLAVPAVNAPVWDFTFQASGEPIHREVLAGRLLAQDVTDPASIPLLLLEVRGRSIDPGTPRVTASATHVLRWSTHGGLAPAAGACTADTLGREVQSPYAAQYYVLATSP
jgi:hypothetical protein